MARRGPSRSRGFPPHFHPLLRAEAQEAHLVPLEAGALRPITAAQSIRASAPLRVFTLVTE